MARGHTMFMHNDKVNIAGVGFYGLGRSDKRTVVDDPVLYTKDLIDALNQAGATVAGYVPLTYDVIGQMVPGSASTRADGTRSTSTGPASTRSTAPTRTTRSSRRPRPPRYRTASSSTALGGDSSATPAM